MNKENRIATRIGDRPWLFFMSSLWFVLRKKSCLTGAETGYYIAPLLLFGAIVSEKMLGIRSEQIDSFSFYLIFYGVPQRDRACIAAEASTGCAC